MVIDGAYAYFASDLHGVIVADISSPQNPIGLASIDVGFVPVYLAGSANCIVAVGGKIAFIDASNPVSPILESTLDSYSAREVDVDSSCNYAYVVDSGGDLLVIDISQMAIPNVVAELPLGSFPKEIDLVGNFTYIAAGGTFLIVDVSVPGSPSITGSLAVTCQLVAATNEFAYLDGVEFGGVQVIDISNKSSPALVSEYQTGSRPVKFVVNGSYIYGVSSQLFGPHTDLFIMDISDPTAIFQTSSMTTPGTAWGIDIQGQYAYVADGGEGLSVFNISDPYNPVLVSGYDVSLTKEVDRVQVQPGETLTYTLSYLNNSTGQVTDVEIEDLIPAGSTYVAGSASNGGQLVGNTVIWNLGTLSAGQSGSVSFQVAVN